MVLSRRRLCYLSASSLLSRALRAQTNQTGSGSSRPDVASIDRVRILAAAGRALTSPIDLVTATRVTQPGAGPNDFVSDADASLAATTPSRSAALLNLTLAVPALAAASFLLAPQDSATSVRYAAQAVAWLDAWFTTPATRLTPSFAAVRLLPDTQRPDPAGLVEAVALAEVAQAIPFLSGTASSAQQAVWRSWFRELAVWLDTDRLAGLARDRKDHTASAWLLLRCAAAALLADEAALVTLRHRLRTITIRAEILAEGTFPHELTTPDPYRNSLFNLDMLAACCVLLSTRFETAWNYELQDGPGMRGAIARHAPWIADRNTWPYPSDDRFFTALPCRRPSLLFAAHAFQQSDYADIWRRLNPDPVEPAILRSFPIRQPLLWTVRPRLTHDETPATQNR